MELRHLRYFKAVAEEGHITRAAERLSIQQPPLSLQIKALETELGVKLFHRRPRGVELTDAGASFHADVSELLADLDAAIAKTRQVARGEQGNIVIGFTSSVIFHAATKSAIRAFRAAFPDVALSLEEDGSTKLIDSIARNKLDAAFVRTSTSHVEGVQILQMLEEPMYLAVPMDHPLAKKTAKPVELHALSDQPLVLYRRSSGPGLYDRIITACAGAGFTPQIVQEAPRVGSTLNLVAAGLGISFVPGSLCASHTDGIAYRPVKCDPPLLAPIMLACRKTEASEAVKSFIQIVRASMVAKN
ncbi:LysR family transcriptional regulator [Denitrobaculum tricleocarpae]|uniref:LysR family transcriptional regulator n=1 Tax=Denitrobaculum tricleocarpae TaxID=2591009 RepID=A0A545U2S7_9PROT|nr:LysR family transcriptional regulator [Denitrobaculum tricleocarpae]TQV83780.1 LysR family transcriptional regulator [Denitrobaculum tricleocarpae]